MEEGKAAPRVALAPGSDLDPALLAFLKCHVTSTLRWEALRVMEEQEGRWLGPEDLARQLRRDRSSIERLMRELARDGLVDELRSGDPDDTSYRLPRDEPTTLVLRRLMRRSLSSADLRGLIAAHLIRMQHPLVVAA